MKPIRNKKYCIGCQRTKMLFESKSKADNFLKYNAAEIMEENHKAPVRSYYCTFCCGWHVTSHQSTLYGESLDLRDAVIVNRLVCQEKGRLEMKPIVEKIDLKIKQIRVEIRLCNFDRAEDLVDSCLMDLEDIIELKGFTNQAKHDDRVARVRDRIYAARNLLNRYKELYFLSKEEQDDILRKNNDLVSVSIIQGFKVIDIIESVTIQNKSQMLSCTDQQIVDEIILKCRSYIASIPNGEGARGARTQLNNKIDELISERKVYQEKLSISSNAAETSEKEINPKSPVEEYEYIDSSVPYSEEDKTNILSVIEKIESIDHEYKDGNISICKDIIDVCYYILDDMKRDDENINLLKGELEKWKERLGT